MAKRLALVLLAALAACRVDDAPNRPIDDHVALCCKAGGGDPLSFTGCRPSNHCRTSETLWVRGPIECGLFDAERCEGGRCCSLDLATPDSASAGEPMIAGQPIESVEVPAPAPIEPMPFEPR